MGHNILKEKLKIFFLTLYILFTSLRLKYSLSIKVGQSETRVRSLQVCLQFYKIFKIASTGDAGWMNFEREHWVVGREEATLYDLMIFDSYTEVLMREIDPFQRLKAGD